MTFTPPPLPYASTSSDEHGSTCPPWIGVGWLVVMLAAIAYGARTMTGQYESIGQPLVVWLSPPPANLTNQRFGMAWPGVVNQQPAALAGSELFVQSTEAFFFCLLLGMTAAATLWHWPRPFLWLLLVLPAATVIWYLIIPQKVPDAAITLAALTRQMNPPTPLAGSQRWSAIPTSFGLQVVGISIGLLTGRPVARLLATVLLPPGVRASVVPYWTAVSRR